MYWVFLSERQRCWGKTGRVTFGAPGPVSEGGLLEKLHFWMVAFLSGMMKGKVMKFNRNALCSAGTLTLLVEG